MATQYVLNINMPQETVDKLSQGNFSLYAFKGAKASLGGGQPTVWLQTTTYSKTTDIKWAEQYQAFTSLTEIANGATISAAAAYPIDLNQQLQVTGQQGTGTVVNGGPAGTISIKNLTKPGKPFTCGLMQLVSGQTSPSPLCAFPLYGALTDAFQPIELVALMFAAGPIDTGTVIYAAMSQGVLVDLTGVSSRTVNFDINDGWSWSGAWGQPIDSEESLAPLLFPTSSSFTRQVLLSAGERTLGAALDYPVGKYTDVRVVDPLTGETLLNHGTGTMSEFQMFSCGNFVSPDYPKIGGRYKITATDPNGKNGDLVLFCTTTNHQTCDFKETKSASSHANGHASAQASAEL